MAQATVKMAARALRLDGAKARREYHSLGPVKSVNADGSCRVLLDGANVSTRCAKGCPASVSDRVLVLVMSDGRCVAICKIDVN